MKMLIGMSGGVDSSVAAFLVRAEGHECHGCMLNFHRGRDNGADIADARAVADKIGIDFFTRNYFDEFEKEVVGRFVDAYKNGLTPNPCFICNRYTKFDRLIAVLDELSLDRVVSGHYARVEYEGGRYVIKRAVDESKDQSYMLASLTQQQLSRIVFPLGGYTKDDVRTIAEREGLINSSKPDSQDICFIPDGDYVSFLESRGVSGTPGDFVDIDGCVLGTHRGFSAYTIGQRKGLGIASDAPLYVTKIDTGSNTVTLGRETDLYSRELYVKDFNPVKLERIDEPMRVLAKVRYRQKAAPALVTPLRDGRMRVVFDEPVRAITPGQSAVLYDGDAVIGGGEVEL